MDETVWVRAAYAVSGPDADRMIALLEDSGIPAKRQGGTRDIYTIKSVYGAEIMVPDLELERAQEILKNAVRKEEKNRTSGAGGERKASPRTIISWLVVAAVLAAILLPLIQSRL